jgi:hypothetical protein
MMNAERLRLEEHRTKKADWKKWGPYLSERQWGTVREDYSASGDAWGYLPHDHARSRAYRWGEDGLGGISDDHQVMCFAIALWNERDPILKERAFGLTNPEGNHGEDVKEYYFYVDSTPTHSYMKYLYKYPQAEYPYNWLLYENARRGGGGFEFELLDTGLFNDDKYFDVFVEYAKGGPEEIFIKITAHNRGNDAAPLHLLPHLWFRNTWAWGGDPQRTNEGNQIYRNQQPVPEIIRLPDSAGAAVLRASIPDGGDGYFGTQTLGDYYFFAEAVDDTIPKPLFTDNETNTERLYNFHNGKTYTKDAINDCVIYGQTNRVNPEERGTKTAMHYSFDIEGKSSKTIRLVLRKGKPDHNAFELFDQTFADRKAEADIFYESVHPAEATPDEKLVQRQAFAGMMWTKQFYYYDVHRWLEGDDPSMPPPQNRKHSRNSEWRTFESAAIISMPDKWEYPWFAAWDLAFHCVPISLIDVDFAKEQLALLVSESFLHPNGQLPAYEWEFSDLNPPVHAWAAWSVYQRERKQRGKSDKAFLEKIYHKLLMNFIWWVNRKDSGGSNIFEGGFLGLDNITIFDRSQPLPGGIRLEQADATGWMGMYCLNLMQIAAELALSNSVYEELAMKFFEHFIYVGDAMNNMGGRGLHLWSDLDGFYCDLLHDPHSGNYTQLRVRSLVGMIPLFATHVLRHEVIKELPAFAERLKWFVQNRGQLFGSDTYSDNTDSERLLCIVGQDRLQRMLQKLLDEQEFLSTYGIRSLSKHHEQNPYILQVDDQIRSVSYEPAEAVTKIKGGNSNWRGPIWMATNYLTIQSLRHYYSFYGVEFDAEHPVGSGQYLTLNEIANDLAHRLISIFLKDEHGRRPVYGGTEKFQNDPYWKDYILFYEYFHGDNGAGLGAAHQTGWTGIVAKLIHDIYEGQRDYSPKMPRRRRIQRDEYGNIIPTRKWNDGSIA